MDGSILNGYFSGGGTVTNVALELAYFLGFSEVILIGVDHSYRAQRGLPGEPVVSNSVDVNHFHPEYFGPGAVWQLPNFETMERGYREAKTLFTENDRKIVDATLEGKLDVFSKVEFTSYLIDSPYRNKRCK
jgi:hypothetical protein